jgi:hypothetical protein
MYLRSLNHRNPNFVQQGNPQKKEGKENTRRIVTTLLTVGAGVTAGLLLRKSLVNNLISFKENYLPEKIRKGAKTIKKEVQEQGGIDKFIENVHKELPEGFRKIYNSNFLKETLTQSIEKPEENIKTNQKIIGNFIDLIKGSKTGRTFAAVGAGVSFVACSSVSNALKFTKAVFDRVTGQEKAQTN